METTKKNSSCRYKECRYRDYLLFYSGSVYLPFPVGKSVQLYEQ